MGRKEGGQGWGGEKGDRGGGGDRGGKGDRDGKEGRGTGVGRRKEGKIELIVGQHNNNKQW